MLALGAILVAGCHQQSPPQAAGPSPTPGVQMFSQFAGRSLADVRDQMNLDYCQVRYRSGMPEGMFEAVYFLEDGNFHVYARRVDGGWVVASPPLLELAKTSADDRVAAWDKESDSRGRH